MIPNLLTVDHFVPIALGGKKYNQNNYKVSCYDCNWKFGNSMEGKEIKYPLKRIALT